MVLDLESTADEDSSTDTSDEEQSGAVLMILSRSGL